MSTKPGTVGRWWGWSRGGLWAGQATLNKLGVLVLTEHAGGSPLNEDGPRHVGALLQILILLFCTDQESPKASGISGIRWVPGKPGIGGSALWETHQSSSP